MPAKAFACICVTIFYTLYGSGLLAQGGKDVQQPKNPGPKPIICLLYIGVLAYQQQKCKKNYITFYIVLKMLKSKVFFKFQFFNKVLVTTTQKNIFRVSAQLKLTIKPLYSESQLNDKRN